MADEYTFDLTEKRDRNNRKYLFGSLRLFNVVFFVFSDPTRPGSHKAIVRPYRAREDGAPEDEFKF
jgi:hypothetical protein